MRRGGGDRGGGPGRQGYPRTARVNELLRQVVAEEIGRVAEADERLELATVTAVESDPDLRRATVYLSSLPEDLEAVLSELRVRLQARVAAQVRLKRTPLLRFVADPAVAQGERVEGILRRIDDQPGQAGVPEGQRQTGWPPGRGAGPGAGRRG